MFNFFCLMRTSIALQRVNNAENERWNRCKSAPVKCLILSFPNSKSTFSHPFKTKCISEAVTIGSTIIFHPSTLWKGMFVILCHVIFQVRLQAKFENSHSVARLRDVLCMNWKGIWQNLLVFPLATKAECCAPQLTYDTKAFLPTDGQAKRNDCHRPSIR